MTLLLDKTDLANNLVRTSANLANLTIALNFGGVALPPAAANHPDAFNNTGLISFPGPITSAYTPATGEILNYSISLNPATGILNVSFRNISMIAGLGANMGTFNNPIIPLNIQIVNPATSTVIYDITDNIQFQYRRTTANGTGLALPALRHAPGGLFMVAKVQGYEEAGAPPNITADNLVLKLSGYLRQPGGAPVVPLSTDNVYIFLGSTCLGFFPASSFSSNSTGKVQSFVNTDQNAAPLKRIVIDNSRGVFVVETYPVKAHDIYGVDALTASGHYPIPLTLTIAASPGAPNPTFDGQSSVVIFRTGNQLRNK